MWFASPPVDVAPPVQKPTHSFAYLNYLAKKRKLETEKEKNTQENDGMDVDAEEESSESPASNRSKVSIDEAWQKAVAQFS